VSKHVAVMSGTKETIFNVLLSTWRSVRRYNRNTTMMTMTQAATAAKLEH